MVLALSQAPGPGEEPASSAGGGCSATPDVVTPSTGSTQWQQAWSFEAGEGKWGGEPDRIKPNLWGACAHGDCLVVISGWKKGAKTHLTGYRIAEDGPQRLWSIFTAPALLTIRGGAGSWCWGVSSSIPRPTHWATVLGVLGYLLVSSLMISR